MALERSWVFPLQAAKFRPSDKLTSNDASFLQNMNCCVYNKALSRIDQQNEVTQAGALAGFFASAQF
jgi:hypothetical protein